MQNITNGNLRVLTYSHIYNFPAADSDAENPTPDLKAELRVVNDVFWIRLCTMSDLGFAEAYMYGDVECDDLVSTFLVSPSMIFGISKSYSFMWLRCSFIIERIYQVLTPVFLTYSHSHKNSPRLVS